ncbi:MAG: GNAT family N-acetyltransferase [Novosphingobium sp.]|uniref:GNAT family N-acetyltransferase n=1 Tax=Novosphingobium sp. TaxID=1874826 RepID=UPI0032B9F9F9
MELTHRLATEADLAVLDALMARAIGQLQHGLISPQQIAVSHKTMGLDRQLVADRTYFIALADGQIAGCGGWSWRGTLFGGDDSIVRRDPRPLDPATDAAKVRAMYTDPAFAQRGVGAFVLRLCENAARAAGFKRVELMASLSGARLYRKAGYIVAEETASPAVDGITVPLLRMEKAL